MDNPCVDILMATFNGGAYLHEQLDSLVGQTYTNWRLTIHDDGSMDRTVAIIKEYQKTDRRIILLEDGIAGLGAAKNYLHLMQHVIGQYYMFCDQDDIWMDQKIAKMIAAIQPYQQPALVYSNAHLYRNGKPIAQKSTDIHPSELRGTLFFNSGIQGCALIFNRALMERLRPFPSQIAMHDHLVTMGAVSFGAIHYVGEALMLYRQHDANVTGNQTTGFFNRMKSFLLNDKPVINATHFEANQAFYQHYQHLLGKNAKNLFTEYFNYANSTNVFRRLAILLKNNFTLGDSKGVLILKTLIRKPISKRDEAAR